MSGAGPYYCLLDHITTLNTSPSRMVHYSLGWDLGAHERAAISRVPAHTWDHVLGTGPSA